MLPAYQNVLSDGTTYTPFIAEGVAGLKCQRPGSPTQYLYFNPSDHTEGDVPNVFVYIGDEPDPSRCPPAHHYVIWPQRPQRSAATIWGRRRQHRRLMRRIARRAARQP